MTMQQMFSTKTDRLSCGTMDFTIHHYAGHVTYDATGFTIKNKDTLFNDLVIILQNSPMRLCNQHGWNLIDHLPHPRRASPNRLQGLQSASPGLNEGSHGVYPTLHPLHQAQPQGPQRF
jgi:hypothetical protein